MAVGDALTTELLRMGYSQGMFPMTEEDGEVRWYRPIRRAIFPLDGFKISRSLARTIRHGRFDVRFDTNFEAVIRGCFRPPEEGNWLSEEFVRVYSEAHREGWAHCVECWREGRIVGGSYGLAMGSFFGAESMFHRETDASKVALWALIERCRELGFTLFDAQIMNPHLASLGAVEISGRTYLRQLHDALSRKTAWSWNGHL